MLQHYDYNIHAQNHGVLGSLPGLLPGFFPALASMEGRTPESKTGRWLCPKLPNPSKSIGQSSCFQWFTGHLEGGISYPIFGQTRMIHDSHIATTRPCVFVKGEKPCPSKKVRNVRSSGNGLNLNGSGSHALLVVSGSHLALMVNTVNTLQLRCP